MALWAVVKKQQGYELYHRSTSNQEAGATCTKGPQSQEMILDFLIIHSQAGFWDGIVLDGRQHIVMEVAFA